jgi:integrase
MSSGIQKLPDGRFQIAYMGPHKCRTVAFTRGGKAYAACPNPCPRIGATELRRERFATRGEARTALTARRSAVDKGEALPEEGKPETLDMLLARLQDYHATERNAARLKLHNLRAAFAGQDARTILQADRLRSYIRTRQETGAADSTIVQELANLRTAANLAGLTWPKKVMPKVRNRRECYFTVPELDRLLTLLPEWLAAAAEYAALSGWRAANVWGLTWDRVDFTEGRVTAPAGTTKSGDPISCTLELPERVNGRMTEGSRLYQLLRAQERTHGPDISPLVFERHDIRTAWDKAVGPDGLDKWARQEDPRAPDGSRRVRPRWHDLRHTFAQHMADAGVDTGDILDAGGWRTASMLTRYTIKTDKAKRAAFAKQAAYLEAQREAANASQVIVMKRRKEA